MIKIQYGAENKQGRIVFDIEHKFGRGICLDDQATMTMRSVIEKHPDAGDFKFFKRTETGELCAGYFNRVAL